MKNNRELIYKKFGGKCAYCGDKLKKGWHVDELLPAKNGMIIETAEANVIGFAKEYLGERIVPPQEYYERLEKAGRLTDEQRLRLDEIREFNN